MRAPVCPGDDLWHNCLLEQAKGSILPVAGEGEES